MLENDYKWEQCRTCKRRDACPCKHDLFDCLKSKHRERDWLIPTEDKRLDELDYKKIGIMPE